MISLEEDRETKKQELIGNIEVGSLVTGVVKNITDFGAFVDLGAMDGLLHITDITWGRVSHPSEVLKLNQEIQCVVLDFDKEICILLFLKSVHNQNKIVLEEFLFAEESVVSNSKKEHFTNQFILSFYKE